jgi:hypothetical protein
MQRSRLSQQIRISCDPSMLILLRTRSPGTPERPAHQEKPRLGVALLGCNPATRFERAKLVLTQFLLLPYTLPVTQFIADRWPVSTMDVARRPNWLGAAPESTSHPS